MLWNNSLNLSVHSVARSSQKLLTNAHSPKSVAWTSETVSLLVCQRTACFLHPKHRPVWTDTRCILLWPVPQSASLFGVRLSVCPVMFVARHTTISMIRCINTQWGFQQILATLNGLTLRDSRRISTKSLRRPAGIERLQAPNPASRINVAEYGVSPCFPPSR